MKLYRIVEQVNGAGVKTWDVEEKTPRYTFWKFVFGGKWELTRILSDRGFELPCRGLDSLQEAQQYLERAKEEHRKWVESRIEKTKVVRVIKVKD